MIRRDFFRAICGALLIGKVPVEVNVVKASKHRIFYATEHWRDRKDFACHLQDITVSIDLKRTPIPEFGRKGPYFKYVQFPVEITTPISLIECG